MPSECPPTFGVSHDLVVGLIAGGDGAIRRAVEFAEDAVSQGWKDLQEYQISAKDIVIGIAASGTTPYVFLHCKLAMRIILLLAVLPVMSHLLWTWQLSFQLLL